MVKDLILQIFLQSEKKPIISNFEIEGVPSFYTAEAYDYIETYVKKNNLDLKEFLANLAILDRMLIRSSTDENYFWKNRYAVIFQLRELLANQTNLSEAPELLVECNDITIRYLYILLKYAHWMKDPEKLAEDPRFFLMMNDLLYAFFLILNDIEDDSYYRSCFHVLRYTIEALKKKANESEANDSEGNDSPGDL